MTTAALEKVTVSSPWLPALATIVSIKQETPNISTYRLRFDEPRIAANFRFEPGQFNMLALPGIGECAISISSDPADRDGIDHTIRIAGNVTRNLAAQKPGAKIAVRGPFGSAWPVELFLGKDVVLATGGVGLAPLRPVLRLIQRRRADFGRVTLLLGARTPAGLLFTDEFQAWQDAAIAVQLTVDIGDDTWRGNIGVVPTLVSRLRLNVERTNLLTCGPEFMMRYVVHESLSRGLKPEQVYLSMERNMSCGIGQCGHCQLGPAFICRQGPVFALLQIEPYLHVEEF